MVFRNLMRTMAGSAVLALSLAGVSPATAHEGKGDTPTNERGVRVETSGDGKRMSFVANLQYNQSGEAQNGSDIEFVRLGGRDYALAGTLRGGMQIIDITRPRSPRRVAVYDCDVTQGDIQVWRNNGRVLASYTADSTFGRGRRGVAVRRATSTSMPSDSGTVIVDITTPAQPAVGELPPGAAGLAQHDDPPQWRLPLQLQLRPHLEHVAHDHDLRHLAARRPRRRCRTTRSRSCPPRWARSRTTSPSTSRARAPTSQRSRRP